MDASAAGSTPPESPAGSGTPGSAGSAAGSSPPLTETTDRLTPLREMQLIRAHLEGGDPDALSALLHSYQGRIYSVCYRMLRRREDAADLTQDALLRIMEGLGSYDGRAAFSTWAIRVAMNCCLSHLRRERIRRHGSLDEPVGPGEEPRHARLPGGGELSGPERVERGETSRIVVRALASLDPAMRAALVLRDLQGLDYQQVGAVLGVAVGTVKSRLFRARAALREEVERQLAGATETEADEEDTDDGGSIE
ncbi:MAG: RNA polymerase sigma factor [Planctomycetes bacterium]|nr:RNA polymerase sigma factor [Planctomycetota bacterium]